MEMALLRSIRLQEALLSYAILRSQHGMRCIVLSRVFVLRLF